MVVRVHAPENNWADLQSALDEPAASGPIEVREDGEWLAELAGLHCEVHFEAKNALIHLWSEERNLTRRLVRLKERSPDRIILEVQRFGKAKPGRLEFLLQEGARPAGSLATTSAHGLAGFSLKNFLTRLWIRSRRRPISNIRFPACTCGARCMRVGADGRCSSRAPARPTRWKTYWRSESCGSIGAGTIPIRGRSKACDCSRRREPRERCANVRWPYLRG